MRKPQNLKQAVRSFLTPDELARFRRAFDCIGDIAILEIPPELEKHEKRIAKTLLDINHTIKVVVKKVGGHKGTYRIQQFRILAGARRKTTFHKENNVRIKVHIEHAYFSIRLSTERLRIAHHVRPEEDVLIMFSGVAPYNVVIAKNSQARSVYGVEINPKAHALACENIALNKVQDRVTLYCGDAKQVVPTLPISFDRIVMPLPKGGEDFLNVAIGQTKQHATIHFYNFLPEDNIDQARQMIHAACAAMGRNYSVMDVRKCGQQSPRVYRVCADFVLD